MKISKLFQLLLSVTSKAVAVAVFGLSHSFQQFIKSIGDRFKLDPQTLFFDKKKLPIGVYTFCSFLNHFLLFLVVLHIELLSWVFKNLFGRMVYVFALAYGFLSRRPLHFASKMLRCKWGTAGLSCIWG